MSNPLFSARPVRLASSLFRWCKIDCLSVSRFHVVADAGSAPYQKSASNNLQKCFIPPTRSDETLVSYRGKTCCSAHQTFLLGSPNECVFTRHHTAPPQKPSTSILHPFGSILRETCYYAHYYSLSFICVTFMLQHSC